MKDSQIEPNPETTRTQTPAQITAPHVDLLARPDGPRDRQLLLGEAVTILDTDAQYSYVRAKKDGYTGYITSDSIGTTETSTHQVSAAATHAYAAPSIKAPDLANLSFGAKVRAIGERTDFIETSIGHVPRQALTTLPAPRRDPINTARLFFGTPYLWGGNTRAGIDCSGLVQAALIAADIDCPGDSAEQEQQLGQLVTNNIYEKGDLIFWKSHVSLVTSATHMIHANAFHMCIVEEPILPAIERIAKNGGGPVTSHKRL